jgi:hypothetical protein
MDPDDCNVAAPVNVGTAEQRKDGILGVNGLAVFGNAIISGVSRYLNFGTSVGESGFGFRDNAGVMEFKDSAGEWMSFNALADDSSSVTIPTCPTGQVLTGSGGGLSCVTNVPTGSWCGLRYFNFCNNSNTGAYEVTYSTNAYGSIACNGAAIRVYCQQDTLNRIDCPSGYSGFLALTVPDPRERWAPFTSGFTSVATCVKN